MQYQDLADRYAPASPAIAETLVKLQLPPDLKNSSLANTSFVPLPKRQPSDSKHQIALIIREGRRVASSLGDPSRSSFRSSKDSLPPTTMTTMSTVLEQDFTVEGKKGSLDCPFSKPAIPESTEGRDATPRSTQPDADDPTPHRSADPICAAMLEETGSQPGQSAQGAAAFKCPIRYLDQHSPEEIAHYLQTHKHELPRSHEVCLQRYQKSEEEVRKLDAKYGNLAGVVEGLSRIHQPMLPEQDTRPQSDVEKASDERVHTWAQTVSAGTADDPDGTTASEEQRQGRAEQRQSHFDRPLKEVRVGESPSRPWGISVPVYDSASYPGDGLERPESPPPAPVQMPSSMQDPGTPNKKPGKCPLSHSKMMGGGGLASMSTRDEKGPDRPGHAPSNRLSTPACPAVPPVAATAAGQPTFLNAHDLTRSKPSGTPQMVFTGPVFIGYPIEQAIEFMQHFQGQHQ